jgi:histidyl-tRNA synthetase
MAKVRFTAPKGMRDIMPDDLEVFRRVESVFRETCRLFAFREIRTPHLESTDLFCRTVGETTDIVEKEMYSLETKGGDRLSLRPETTAGVVRAYLEHGLHRTAPLQKLYYYGEQFRHESAQKKRYREFTQAGVELLGSDDASADVEVISLAVEYFRKLELGDVRVELNSFGCPECRPAFREALLAYFKEREAKLCRDCKRRLERNVFRLLDCKEDACRALAAEAPTIDDHLDEECRAHFAEVAKGLETIGVSYQRNTRLVRGLDYYTRTIFEIFPSGGEGRQAALGAGGRYDGLAELLGGKPVPAVGFALGVDRIVLEIGGNADDPGAKPRACVVGIWPASAHVAKDLRQASIPAVSADYRKSLSAQMKAAGKSGAPVSVIVGSDEFARGSVVLKNMTSGGQREVALDSVVAEVEKELGSAGDQTEETKP